MVVQFSSPARAVFHATDGFEKYDTIPKKLMDGINLRERDTRNPYVARYSAVDSRR